eukprot:8384327-Heterocapsa_arctica.AAC.1
MSFRRAQPPRRTSSLLDRVLLLLRLRHLLGLVLGLRRRLRARRARLGVGVGGLREDRVDGAAGRGPGAAGGGD